MPENFQKASCTVRVAGNLNFTVQRVGVTAPEILFLRAIHGADAIVDVQRTDGVIVSTTAQERARLMREYARSGEHEAHTKLLNDMFPGVDPRMPTAIEDVLQAVQEPEAPEAIMPPEPARKDTSAAIEQAPVDPDADAIEASEPDDYSFLNDKDKTEEVAAAAKSKPPKKAA